MRRGSAETLRRSSASCPTRRPCTRMLQRTRPAAAMIVSVCARSTRAFVVRRRLPLRPSGPFLCPEHGAPRKRRRRPASGVIAEMVDEVLAELGDLSRQMRIVLREPVFACRDLRREPVFARCDPRYEPVFARYDLRCEPVFVRCDLRCESGFVRCDLRCEPVFVRCDLRCEPVFARCDLRCESGFVRCDPRCESGFTRCDPRREKVPQVPRRRPGGAGDGCDDHDDGPGVAKELHERSSELPPPGADHARRP